MTLSPKKNQFKTFVLGLTGGIASGKSSVAEVFINHSIPVICGDEIAHKLLSDDLFIQKKIIKYFGASILNTKNQIDRTLLGNFVFKNKKSLKALEMILHPKIKNEIFKQLNILKHKKTPLIVLNVPLLFEVNLHRVCDQVICVYATQKQQIERLKKRNGLSQKQALLRIHAQMPLKKKCALADVVFKNTSTRKVLRKVVFTFLKHQVQL